MVASCALHVSLIASLGLMLTPRRVPQAAPAIRTTWNAPAPDVRLPEVDLELSRPSERDSGGRANPLLAADAPRIEPTIPHDFRVASLTGPLVAELLVNEAAPRSAVGGSGEGLGNTEGAGGGAGQGAASEFFPLDQDASTFVFVVDSSKSMNHPYPGPAKTRLGRVKIELWRTIYQMTAKQRFFIVFFNTQSIPMPASGLQPGGMQSQGELLNWTAAVRADGQTDPQQALLTAMRMRPDVIYFLTDGEFNYRVVREVTKSNYGGVRIHTLSLGDDSGRRFLEEIAAGNGGVYRHIVEEEDQYWDEAAAATVPRRRVAPPRAVQADSAGQAER